MAEQRKLRVLVLADSCNPEWPSLPVVGYKAARALADICDVTVATQIRNKKNIDAAGFGQASVEYIDTEYVAGPIHKFVKAIRGTEGGWTTTMAFAYPTYIAFEIGVWKRFKQRIRSGEFDVIHRITPMSPTLPSFIAKRSPIPFVVGPLNGGLKWPKEFLAELKQEKEWLSLIRGVYKILPYSRSTYSKSSAILASFQHTIDQVPKKHLGKVIDFPEIGLDPELFNQNPAKPIAEKKKILFAGRLVPYKLPKLVIEAFASSEKLRQHELVIVGDGPLHQEMTEIARRAGIEHQVSFEGWKTQQQVGDYMRECDVFAFPSIRELGAGVVVEAMACGLVCAVVDYGAPGILIDDSCGVKIPISDRESMTSAYAKALEAAIDNDENLLAMSRLAYERAMNFFSWNVKARKTLEVYDWVLGKEEDKPSFWAG